MDYCPGRKKKSALCPVDLPEVIIKTTAGSLCQQCFENKENVFRPQVFQGLSKVSRETPKARGEFGCHVVQSPHFIDEESGALGNYVTSPRFPGLFLSMDCCQSLKLEGRWLMKAHSG